MNMRDYLKSLQQEVVIEATREGTERGLPEAFTELLIGTMTDAGFIEDGTVALFEARGMRASGFSVDSDASTLDVFVTDYVTRPDVRSVGKAEIEKAFRRVTSFVSRAQAGLWRDLEESSPVWDMAHRIAEVWPSLSKVRLTLLTNGHLKAAALPKDAPLSGVACTHHVWDLERLYRLNTSGRQQEPIDVDLNKIWGAPIRCLGPEGQAGDYEAFLLMLPGQVLADIYERYGARLLELNVRSFLQARGKINRGIQETLKSEPRRFLAYNNGISLTAGGVDVVRDASGASAIAAIHDVQIVNGGQTTASLYHARLRGKIDLEGVYVQAKLSVVGPEQLQSLVPRISEYSNSQNRVNSADFSATDPFHVELEKLSRTMWAPGRDGSHMLTRWFYERARGQYADAVAMERTVAKRRQFQQINPASQKFAKVDVAKYENTWDQLPYLVALGNEKNFREFTLRLKQRTNFTPGPEYFRRLVAKALIFRTAESLIGKLNLGGYRSQTVTYTLSLIANRTAQRLDLEAIWASQGISAALSKEIVELAPQVHALLLSSAGRANVGEWAKKPGCWEEMQKLVWQPSVALRRELITSRGASRATTASVAEVLTSEEQKSMERVTQTSPDVWFALAAWAKQTGNLAAWQRGLAFSLGRLSASENAPSRKQVIQGAKILDEAARLGFGQESPSGE